MAETPKSRLVVHLDPSAKEGLVGQMANQGLSEEHLLAEIAKCAVLCENCHRKEHWP